MNNKIEIAVKSTWDKIVFKAFKFIPKSLRFSSFAARLMKLMVRVPYKLPYSVKKITAEEHDAFQASDIKGRALLAWQTPDASSQRAAKHNARVRELVLAHGDNWQEHYEREFKIK